MAYDFDIVVIGGGPGGYVAAIRSSQLGANTALVEKDFLGGTCLNRGCIPTKALISSTEKISVIKEAEKFGIDVPQFSVDFGKIRQKKDDIVSRQRNGIGYLLKKNGIKVFNKEAAFFDEHTLSLGDEQITSQKFIIASGSIPKRLPFGRNNPRVITSDELLEITEIPHKLVIIGGGVIGVEFAGIFHNLGTEVTIVEMMKTILPTVDVAISTEMGRVLSRRGINILTGCTVQDISDDPQPITTVVKGDGSIQHLSADLVLCATGRAPFTHNLYLDKAGVEYDVRAGVDVDEHMMTNKAHIAAIGDVTGGVQLAHVASAQGIVATESLLGFESTINLSVIPSCVYGSPEIATVGLSQEEASSRGLNWKKAVFPLAACAKAATMGETEGFVKVIYAADSHRVLGLHIMAPHATDIIMEGVVALSEQLTVNDLGSVIHPHPTIAEAVMEAMHLAEGNPIHLVQQ